MVSSKKVNVMMTIKETSFCTFALIQVDALSHSSTTFSILLHLGRGAEYCDHFVCLSVCLSVSVSVCVCVSVREHVYGTAVPICTKFLTQIPCSVARSSSGGVALRYVLPVLWMTSRSSVVGLMRMCAIPGQSLMSMNALF